MERNNANYLVFEEYFKSNQFIVDKFFDEQFKMFELQQGSLVETDRTKLFMDLMELNKNIILSALDAQKYGASFLIKDPQNTHSIELLPLNEAAATSMNSRPEVMEPVEKPELPSTPSMRATLEQWIQRELSRITGLPIDRITGSMKFEEDLGLVSIDMVELFSGLVEEFPHLNRDLADVIGAASIDEFLDVMLQDEIKKKSDVEIVDTSALLDPEIDEVNGLMQEIKKKVSMKANIPIEKIASETTFDSMNVDIFSLETIYDGLLSRNGRYHLFKQELLYAVNLEQVARLLDHCILLSPEQSDQYHRENEVDVEEEGLSEIQRYTFDYVKWDAGVDYELPESMLLIGIKNEMFDHYAAQFKQNGIKLHEVYITESGWKAPNMGSDFIDFNDKVGFQNYLASYVDSAGNLPSMTFLVTDSNEVLNEAEHQTWNVKIEQTAVALFIISDLYSQAKEIKSPKNFVSIIGESSSCPISSTARGIARTMAHDLKNKYHIRSIWLEEAYNLIPIVHIYRALFRGPSDHDIFIDSNDITIRALKVQAIEEASKSSLDISNSSTIVVFGGGDGISAEIACAMAAKYGCRIIVVGRTSFPTEHVYEDLQDETMLKQKIFAELSNQLNGAEHVTKDLLESETKRIYRQRALLHTKNRIEQAGSEFHYYSCDISIYSELKDLLEIIHEQHGEISGIIHGAGVVNGQKNKSIDSFRNNLYIKTNSMYALYHFFKNYPLKFSILFSSISAYAGIPRISDYSASNEFVNAFAANWKRQAQYPVLSMMWSLWTQTGMGKNTMRNVERLNLQGISNQQGIHLFFRELEHLDQSPDSVLLTHDSMLEFSMP